MPYPVPIFLARSATAVHACQSRSIRLLC